MGSDRPPAPEATARHRAVVLVLATVGLALGVAGARGVATVAAQEPGAATDDLGAALYGRDCVYCHGQQGQGSPRGVPIADAGEASAHYALVTGRMPLDDPGEIPRRGPTPYTREEIAALTAHVAAFGDGPELPDLTGEEADVAQGGRLYRLHCGACHGATAAGGAQADDRTAPPLFESEPSVVAAAVVAGPGAMPAFAPQGFTDLELASIVAYVQHLREPDDRGGWTIFRTGRPDEALVALLLATPAFVALAAWIARRPARAEGR